MHWFDNFDVRHFDIADPKARQFVFTPRVSQGLPGGRPALLLLHGFPQSHVMWNRVAHQLQRDFFLVMPGPARLW